jgi:hypothetical protein
MDDDPYVSGMVFGITRKISPKLAGEILDEIASRIRQSNKAKHWRPGYELSYSVEQLIVKTIENDHIPGPERAWSWLKLTNGDRGYSS